MATTEPPLVSIIVPFDVSLGDALETAFEQTYERLEIVHLVTSQTTNRFEAVRGNRRIQVVMLAGTRLCEGAVLDLGVRQASGRYITLLTPDVRFHPERIEVLVGHAARTGARLLFTEAEVDLPREEALAYLSALAQRHSRPTLGHALLEASLSHSPGNLFFTRELFDRVGGFIHRESGYDYDFVLRALEHVEPSLVGRKLLSISARSDRGAQLQQRLARERYFVRLAEALSEGRAFANPFAPGPTQWRFKFHDFFHWSGFAEKLRLSTRLSFTQEFPQRIVELTGNLDEDSIIPLLRAYRGDRVTRRGELPAAPSPVVGAWHAHITTANIRLPFGTILRVELQHQGLVSPDAFDGLVLAAFDGDRLMGAGREVEPGVFAVLMEGTRYETHSESRWSWEWLQDLHETSRAAREARVTWSRVEAGAPTLVHARGKAYKAITSSGQGSIDQVVRGETSLAFRGSTRDPGSTSAPEGFLVLCNGQPMASRLRRQPNGAFELFVELERIEQKPIGPLEMAKLMVFALYERGVAVLLDRRLVLFDGFDWIVRDRAPAHAPLGRVIRTETGWRLQDRDWKIGKARAWVRSQPRYGVIDRAEVRDGRLIVEGWAWDTASPRPAEAVLVTSDGNPLGIVAPAVERADLMSLYELELPPVAGFRCELTAPAQAGSEIQAFALFNSGTALPLPHFVPPKPLLAT